MSKVSFTMREVTEKREKKVKKRSIYDPIIDQFLECGKDLVEIKVEDKKPTYVAGQLTRRIHVRELKIKATVVDDLIYLEKA